MTEDDWQLDEGLDPEGPSAADLDRFGAELSPCPECGSEVYDQATICPTCGGFLHEPKKTPTWAVLVVLAILVVFALAFVF